MITNFLFRIQTDPNASADPIAQAIYGKRTVVDGETFENQQARTVSWRLHGTDKSTTIGGLTLTDAQVSAFVVAIADREFAAAQG